MVEFLSEARVWQLHRYSFDRCFGELDGPLSGFGPDLASRGGALGVRDGQRFLLDPSGRPDLRVNACLASAKWRNLGERSQRDYTYSIGVWLNFLVALGINWWDAVEEDAEEFLFWRVTDPANDERVQTNSFSRDLAALKKFYRWMNRRYGIVNPFEEFRAPRAAKREDVKWLDPGGFRRWLDLGIRGLDLSGRPDRWWRGRNEQRDAAFCDGLYGNGLRVSEWASVVLPELPPYDRRRGSYTCQLADACAKGGYGHPYWTPRSAMKALLSYGEGARAAAVRRAQTASRYERVKGLRLVLATHGTHAVTLKGVRGGTERKAWNDIGPRTRLRLFRRTPQGLEPVALWLNEDGLPRDGRGWEHTFDAANERIAGLGLESFSCTAHMLRHSFALKWYAIGKLVHAARMGHLTAAEQQDFREQFGDTWHLVQTMLGHRSVETTKEVYLEPFRAMDVEVLLAHAEGFPIAAFMADVFTGHPRVRTDPMAVAR
ncbi:tyrosine-type recombinase/integrase [Streptomyces sp. NPDC058394]|uniref:tyrosine-type recombinase/integrase n=1 Tax=Streptomyces sp. NPDC058394 TaxID=3346477 RepID=UPI003650B88A